MKNLGNVGALYLGFSLGTVGNLPWYDVKFWVIALPTIVLFVADKKFNKK